MDMAVSRRRICLRSRCIWGSTSSWEHVAENSDHLAKRLGEVLLVRPRGHGVGHEVGEARLVHGPVAAVDFGPPCCSSSRLASRMGLGCSLTPVSCTGVMSQRSHANRALGAGFGSLPDGMLASCPFQYGSSVPGETVRTPLGNAVLSGRRPPVTVVSKSEKY